MLNKLKELFAKKVDYKEMYEEKRKECDNWEFKFNKLHRQLQAILKESNQ